MAETLTKAWWLEHGATYIDEFPGGPAYEAQELALVAVLDKLDGRAPGQSRPQLDFSTILEVGCGFGRITRLVYDAFRPRAYLATDVSQDALNNAREYCQGRPTIDFRLRDLDAFGATPQYDLVLAAEVLMHRTPAQIVGDCEMLTHHAAKYVVNVDWYEPSFKGEAPGCYQHDYAALFASYGSVERIDVPAARQAIWVTRIERAE